MCPSRRFQPGELIVNLRQMFVDSSNGNTSQEIKFYHHLCHNNVLWTNSVNDKKVVRSKNLNHIKEVALHCISSSFCGSVTANGRFHPFILYCHLINQNHIIQKKITYFVLMKPVSRYEALPSWCHYPSTPWVFILWKKLLLMLDSSMNKSIPTKSYQGPW